LTYASTQSVLDFKTHTARKEKGKVSKDGFRQTTLSFVSSRKQEKRPKDSQLDRLRAMALKLLGITLHILHSLPMLISLQESVSESTMTSSASFAGCMLSTFGAATTRLARSSSQPSSPGSRNARTQTTLRNAISASGLPGKSYLSMNRLWSFGWCWMRL